MHNHEIIPLEHKQEHGNVLDWRKQEWNWPTIHINFTPVSTTDWKLLLFRLNSNIFLYETCQVTDILHGKEKNTIYSYILYRRC